MANPQDTGLHPGNQNMIGVAEGTQRVKVYIYGEDGAHALS